MRASQKSERQGEQRKNKKKKKESNEDLKVQCRNNYWYRTIN